MLSIVDCRCCYKLISLWIKYNTISEILVVYYPMVIWFSVCFIIYHLFLKIYRIVSLDGQNNSIISNSQCNGRRRMEAISKMS